MECFDLGFKKRDKLMHQYLRSRLIILKGKDHDALKLEFKEWLSEENDYQEDIWSIPDLTDRRLRSFFLRVLAQIH